MQRAIISASHMFTAIVVLLVSGTAAQSADMPMTGKVMIIKPEKLSKFVSKDEAGFLLPTAGSDEDPTVGSAQLGFFDEGADGGAVTFILDKSGWKALGNPAGAKGYRYKGQDDIEDLAPKGTCRRVLLKAKVIKAACKGPKIALTTPYAGTAATTLAIPAETASSVYCAAFGGTNTKNDARLLKRKNAGRPSACPTVPEDFDGFQPSDVVQLADDSLNGRNNNAPGSILAQNFLIDELEQFADGLDSIRTGDAAYKQSFALGTNILAVIPGGTLADEYVIVGAHYDHLSCVGVCNGATDNAAGVAAVLAIGRQIAQRTVPLKRSVILALWDAEEDGLVGSRHYVQNPLVPLANTIAYVNFDIQGANLLPSLRNFSAAVAAETGGADFQTMLDDAIAGEGLGTEPLSYIFGQERSDYANFVNSNIPSVFFSDSTGGCYHTAHDDVDIVDFAKLEKQAKIALKLTVDLAETDTPPTFAAPNPAMATFADALAINDVVNSAIASDLGLFSPSEQSQLLVFQSDLNAIVADGEAAFDTTDVFVLLLGTLDVINIMTSMDCNGFL